MKYKFDNFIKIKFDKFASYGPTMAPNVFGNLQEIIKSNDSFEKEHNSAWYYFDITNDGGLSIEIDPIQKGDDYDFMLFQYTDSFFLHLPSPLLSYPSSEK